MHSLAYLARQPILDRDGKIFAYELLFRDSPESDIAVISSDVQATAQVLENVLNNIGFQRLIGDHKAFINCSRQMLLDNIFGLLNPANFVLEILEDVEVDSTLIRAVERYKARGFEIALDDFIYNDDYIRRFEPLFKYVSYVKMDIADNDKESLEKAVQFFRPMHIKILAEKVEDESTFKKCLDDGYDYFQGFFFAKPELVTGQKIDATSVAILRILLLLQSRPSLEELCEKLDETPDIAANLLKFVNSGNNGEGNGIKTVKDAIVWVGMSHIHKWLMLMLYARPELGISPQSSPLFQSAAHRAKFLEIVAKAIEPTNPLFAAKAFMVGLISRMDALVRAPLETILPESPADDEMSESLLNRKGKLGTLLRLADAVELDDRKAILMTIEELKISTKQLNRCINEAYSWANEC